MELARITNKDLEQMTVGKYYSWTLDNKALKTARQLIYNRQRDFVGCEFDTSLALPVSNMEGFFSFIVKRLSYGKSTSGNWEPGTPDKWIKHHA